MPSRPRLSFAVPWQAVLGTFVVVAQPACATDAVKRAPAHPDKAWTLPEDSDYTRALREAAREDAAAGGGPEGGAAGGAERQPPKTASDDEEKSDAARQNRVRFESGRKYTLPELIDIAERHHPETREAWEKARQAALAVGIAEATYLPELSAQVVAGYQRTAMPIPTSVVPSGVMKFTSAEAIPVLAAKWLLFDLGRCAAVDEAEANSVVANVTFTEAHEKVIFAVSQAYFALEAARASVRVAEQAAENARRTQDISDARRVQGIATVVEVAQARRQTAQARFELVKAQGTEQTAYSALVASMGVAPNGAIQIADGVDRSLPAAPMQSLRALVERALASRPDVVAALGKVRAAEAGLEGARAAFWPTIGVNAQFYGNFGGWNSGTGFFGVAQPGWNVMLGLGLPLFDGGARQAKVEIASSGVSAARAALDGARDQAAQEITSAYENLQTSFAEYKAAIDVEQAAQTALDAAIGAYQSGMGPLTDALSAENAASSSQLQTETARASVFTSAAQLAFALGSVTRR